MDELEAAPAMARVQIRFDDLARKLEPVQPLADEIDRRTAEFARRSLARSRYLQDVVGERRAQVKGVFERVNEAFADREPEAFALNVADALLCCPSHKCSPLISRKDKSGFEIHLDKI